MAGQDDGWETITDPTDVPAEIRKSLGVKGVRTALGIDANDDAEDGGKPIPQWAEKKYSPQVETYAGLSTALSTFKDGFGGNTVTGDLENWAQGKWAGFGTEGQRDWWAQFRSNDNQIRNKLFGSALTEQEKAAYDATSVNPSMDPKEIRKNLTSRRALVQKALQRSTKFLGAQGYSKESIAALAGEYAPELGAIEEPAKGGDQTSNVAGGASNDSTAPPPSSDIPPTTDASPTELVRADQAPQEMAAAVADFSPEQRAAIATIARTGTGDQLKAVLSGFGRAFTGSDEELAKLVAFYKDPKNVNVPLNLPETDKTLKSVDAGDGAAGAAARGAGSLLTAGFLDEAGALADTVVRGGTYAQNLDTRRGQEKYDEENNLWARVGGQLIAGAVLPSRIIGAGTEAALAAGRAGIGRVGALTAGARAAGIRGAGEGAAYGGAYGVGDADGGAGSRVLGGAAGALVGGAAGGLTAFAGARAANALNQRARMATGALTEGQQTLAAMERQDIVPFAADVGGPVTRMSTAGAAQTLGGTGPIRRAAQATLDSAQAVRDRVAASVGTALNPEAAGETARQGADAFIARSGRVIGRIYDAAEGMAGRAMVESPEALRVLNQELPALEEAGIASPGLGVLQGLRESLSQPRTVRGLRNMRSTIREEFEGAGLRGSNSERIANRVMDAASDDIVNGLRAQGQDRAATLYRRADRLWRERLTTIDDFLEPILGKNTEKSGEEIIKGLKSAMAGNNRRFVGFVNALPREEQGIVRASIISRLGQASKGQQDETSEVFSLSTFLTNWTDDSLGETAKQALVGPEGRAALNDLARVASGAKVSMKYAGHSNSGAVIGTNVVLGGVAAMGPGIALAAKALAVSYGAGRLLASPRFARWIARMPANPNASAGRAYIGRLGRIAQSEPAIANEVIELQRRLTEAFTSVPTRLAAEERNGGDATVQGQAPEQQANQQGSRP